MSPATLRLPASVLSPYWHVAGGCIRIGIQEAPTTNDRRRVEKQVEADDVGLQCLRQGEEEDCTTVIWRQWVLVKDDDDGA